MTVQVIDTAAIVTGAASGLGAATAAALAQHGAHAYRFDLPDAIPNATDVTGVTYVPVDVTDPHQVQAAVDYATSGSAPLRIVVSCAGIGPSMRILGKKGRTTSPSTPRSCRSTWSARST